MPFLPLLTFLLYFFSASCASATEPSIIDAAKKEGSLVFYTTMDIQNSKPLLDAFMKKYPFIKGDLVRLGGTAMVSRIITEAHLPKTYDDLLKPQYKQKFIIDIENHDVFVGLSQEWGQERAINYFKGLAKQEPVFLRGNTNRANMVSVGERSMTFVYAQVIERMKQTGAPVDWIPLEPVNVEVNVSMLAAKAAHPNAGKLFVDYLISKDGQEFLKTFRRIGPRKDVKPDPPKLFEGFRRRVVTPDVYKNLREITKLHNDALGIR